MQLDLLFVFVDVAVGFATLLPFVLVMLMGRRFERISQAKFYWWFFLVSVVGFGVYLLVSWLQRSGLVDFGYSFWAYLAPSFLLIGVGDMGGMYFFLRRIGDVSRLSFAVLLSVGVALPVVVDVFHESAGYTAIIPHPMPDIILVQISLGWLFISYSYLMIGRIASFFSVWSRRLLSLAGFGYMALAVFLIFITESIIYQSLSPAAETTYILIGSSVGAFGGALSVAAVVSLYWGRPSRQMHHHQFETGMPELDAALGGGLVCPVSLVVMGEAGSGKTTVAQNVAITQLRRGSSVIYLCLDNLPENVRSGMRRLGLDPTPYEESGHLVMIDGYSVRAGVKSREKYTTLLQLSDIGISVTNALQKLRGDQMCIVVESLSLLLDESGHEKGIIFLRNLVAKTRLSGASLIVTYNPVAFPPAISAFVQEAVDGTIELKIDESRQGLIRMIRVPRLANTKPLSQWIRAE